MKAVSLSLAFLLNIILFGYSESLWDPNFPGYYSLNPRVTPGEIVTIVIDTDSSLEFSAAHSGEKEVSLEFSGGDTGNLFSFLPDIQVSDATDVDGSDELSFTTSIAARVVEIDEVGMAYVQGSRTVSVQEAVQAVTVSGWLHPDRMSSGKPVRLEQLADVRLTFRSFVESERPLLTEDDIRELMAKPTGDAATSEAGVTGQAPQTNQPEEQPVAEEAQTNQPAEQPVAEEAGPQETTPGEPEPGLAVGEPVAGSVPAQTAGQGVSPAGAAQPRLGLSEEKKRELLLQYINEFLYLMFGQGE